MKKWMLGVACLLAFAFGAPGAFVTSPAQAQVVTTKYTLTANAWTDLGTGPVLVSTAGRIVFAVADTTPTLVAEGFSVLPGASFTFNTTSHVWARSLDGISPFVYASPILASGGSGGGTITSGSTPIAGTCPSGQFLYNNAGVVGCSASSASIAFPQAVTGGVSGGVPYFASTTSMAAGALLANNAVMLGGGAAASPKTTTTGAGVVAAFAVAPNAAGGMALVSTVPTAGNFVKWAAGGLVDGGASSGGGTITAGTTPTSGIGVGQILISDGSLVQGAAGGQPGAGFPSPVTLATQYRASQITYNGAEVFFLSDYYSGSNPMLALSALAPLAWANGVGTGPSNHVDMSLNYEYPAVGTLSQRWLTSAQAFRVYNTWTDANNGEWGAFDWKTTANVLTLGAENNGTGTLRPVQLVGSNIRVPSLTSVGTKPTVTGAGGTCAAGTTVGGALAGTFQTSAVCAAGNTLALTGMPATATGYACDATDRTLPAALIQETATTTTGATFTVAGTSTAASNVVQWKCIGY